MIHILGYLPGSFFLACLKSQGQQHIHTHIKKMHTEFGCLTA